jgi:alkylhydroperoxidase family enzyme
MNGGYTSPSSLNRVGLTSEQISSITHGSASDDCWSDQRDRILILVTDALHDNADLDDDLWHRLQAHLSDEQALDLVMLAGWYHAISYASNCARVALEPGAPRFADV